MTPVPAGTQWHVNLLCDVCSRSVGRVTGFEPDDVILDNDAGYVDGLRVSTVVGIALEDGAVMMCGAPCLAAERDPLVCSDACELRAVEKFPEAR